MKLYKTTITPTSNFLTPLKGDTLFGHLCWSIRFVFGKKRLEEFLNDYDNNPFLIISDGFPTGYLPKPKMMSNLLGENTLEKKSNRKKVWLAKKELENGEYYKARTDKEINNIDKKDTIIRNSINYKTATTEGDKFSPYGVNEMSFSKKDIFFLVRFDFKLEELNKCLEFVSKSGYGKDSTIGKGRFEFTSFEEVDKNDISNTYMALSPFVVHNLKCKEIYYEPFTRFGKSGASRAFKNPFKKPIIFADYGAVIKFEKKMDIRYIGKAVTNISTYNDIVHQGYSIVLPIKELGQ